MALKSIRGRCRGGKIEMLEPSPFSDAEVIITFLSSSSKSNDKFVERVRALSGSWKDSRPAEEIVREIEQTRINKIFREI